MLQYAKIGLRGLLLLVISGLFLPALIVVAIIVRYRGVEVDQPRLVWGSTPIMNFSYWCRAMAAIGFTSETFTTDYYSIHTREDWDLLLEEEIPHVWRPVKPFVAFLVCLTRYDVFFTSCDGFFLGNTPLRFFQAQLLKLAGKKVVVMPYGSDCYVYKNIRSVGTLHGLLMSYPQAAKEQARISNNVDYWTARAHAYLPGIMGPDGFGRWDVIAPSALAVDLDVWQQSKKHSSANGALGPVVIAHAPNHRGFKGTEFVMHAVEQLKNEGLQVQLILLERVSNAEIRRVLAEDADILVEQIIYTGHGLNGLEGMASGLPTICNLEDQQYILPMRRWSYFDECPLVSATPENLAEVLRKLVTRPEIRHQVGTAGREYVEKYHGLDSAQYLFTNVIDYVYGRKDSLINLYHPLLGDYPNRSPKVQHPLINNRIAD